ncbi:MAG TPA: enolase, partial [Planctomycetaceae bacterium]|nr:enolase [Planctomycetaceae bacterium]
MPQIESFRAIEILDSRGRPTVKVTCRFPDGTQASASVPSGASTGRAEALELRDGDKNRYRGAGCRKAVANVNQFISREFRGTSFSTQREFDNFLIALDGTPHKSRLGANAMLGCSLAFCRAASQQKQTPLYQHFAQEFSQKAARLPRLSINLFSGGKHAGGQVPIQDILLVPLAATIDESLTMTYEIYQAAAELCAKRFQMRLLTADEGGLAPPCTCCEEMFELAVEAIDRTDLSDSVKLAVDVAASHFQTNGGYQLDGQTLSGEEMVQKILHWIDRYPLISVEDALAEEDWVHWTSLMEQAPHGVCIVGDDLLCTNPGRIERAIESRAANTLLLKVNQIGTLTEAAEANRLARAADWNVVISARSGETEDDWLADLAVGWSGDFIKVGSITQSERLAKYNRLLEIEHETGWTI